MKARLAFLTSPEPGVYLVNLQEDGNEDLMRFEIARTHLANIVADGANLLLRESTLNRVPATPTEEREHERAEHRA